MTAAPDLKRRLESARPEPAGNPPPLASVLAAIEHAERALGVAGAHKCRWWRRGRTAAALALGAAVLAGAGGGALLLSPGKALQPGFALPANPQTGLGQPVTATLTPLPMRVADPGGGPPWAMRVIRTTRGLVCLQGGRVVDGQLGGLGSGYAFAGDGRFHPFLAQDAIATDACPAVGAAGLAFLPGPPVIVTANALPLAGENVAPGQQVHCDLPGVENWGVRCPQSELRQVAMGLLGPEAVSIQLSYAGARTTIKPYGREGAYLIVLPAQPHANQTMSSGSWEGPFGSVSSAPGGAVLAVTYSDGSRCQIPITNPQQQCHARPSGEGAPIASGPSVSSEVSVSYAPRSSHLTAPLIAAARSDDPNVQKSFAGAFGEGRPAPALTVSFKAPVAAANASTAYVVELRPGQVSSCATPSLIVSQPTDHTITAGQPVAITVPLEDGCATSYSGRVFLARSAAIGGESGDEGPLYEAIASQFGPGAHQNPGRFPTVGRFQISVP